MGMVQGGRGGEKAREMYLMQFPGEEEDEGGMAEDEEGEGSLGVEGEEISNIKEEVRETCFLRGRGVGGESRSESLPLLSSFTQTKKRQKREH